MKVMGENKVVILITAGLVLLAVAFFYTVQGEAEDYRATISTKVEVEQTWELPKALKEVSGIAFLEPGKIACVQDEDGIIFIYDLETSKVEKEIEFADGGDYEGLTINEGTAYILRSDGTLFRVRDFMNDHETESFETSSFTSKNDMEGLFFDPGENQLLLAVKMKDPNSKEYKGIYAIDPASMKLKEEPAYKLNFEDEVFDKVRKKKAEETFFPSEVNRDPQTGNLLVLEAREPRLLVLDPEGNPLVIHKLDRKTFPQPEGLTFDPSGNLYISSEGNPGTIHRVRINEN